MTGTPPRRHAAACSLLLLAAVLITGVVFLTKHDSRAEAVQLETTPARVAASAAAELPETTAPADSHLTDVRMSWSPDQLMTLIQNAVDSASSDITVSSVSLEAPDTVTVSGTLERSVLEALLESSDIEARSTLEMAVKLLPDAIDLSIAFTLSVEDNRLTVQPVTLEASSITLPASVVPEHMVEDMNTAIADSLTSSGCTPESLEIADNTLTLVAWID